MWDLTEKCCGTCADEDCKMRQRDPSGGVFLRRQYCEGTGYSLWKPMYCDETNKSEN